MCPCPLCKRECYKKGILFVCLDRVEFTYLGNKLDLCVSVEGFFYKTIKEDAGNLIIICITSFSYINLSFCTCPLISTVYSFTSTRAVH
jgi:hypothetical protein